MGKYMKKSKITGDIAVMEVSPSSIGVRTRAKTLALRTLSPDHPDQSSFCYLQLRSRRLHKPPPPPSVNTSTTCTHLNPNPIPPTSTLPPRSLSCSSNHIDPCSSNNEGTEASFGDNSSDFEDRGTGESTPCSLIRASNTIGTPGSTARQRAMPATYQDDRRIVPTQHEIEEFFARAEQQEARLFIEKYNFDILNGLPLPGRYEWVEVAP